MGQTASARTRASLSHPILDADAHTLEFLPGLLPYIRQLAGGKVAEDAERALLPKLRTLSERIERWSPRGGFWICQSRTTEDRATVYLPRLMRARVEELGFDFMVVYPSIGLFLSGLEDDEVRRVCCRALNDYHADMFQGCEDRLAPVAVIPMHTPEEACEELRHVKSRGFKAVLIPGHVERKLPDGRGRLDFLGIDSAHDYDPFFKLCLKEQVSVSTHDLLRNVSPSSFVFNHIGQFSNSHLAFAKALFLGGVLRRNPQLKIAYLEGGVGWAFNLVWALIEHWEKRNPEALELYRPERVDYSKLAGLFREHGGKLASLEESVVTGFRHFGDAPPDAESPVDEFALAGIDSKQAVIDAMSNHLFVGCEGEDRSVTLAFQRKALPKGIPLNVMFGSDVGHWDEPDITEVVAETHELVEKGLLSPEEFEAFTLTNAVRFYGGSNPAFFRGTALESVAEKILAAPADRRAGA